MLRELKEDTELAKNGEYVNRLAFYLIPNTEPYIDQESNEIALDLLVTRGMPVVSEPYFDHQGERGVLYLFMESYDVEKFPEGKKDDAKELLSNYITQDHGDTLALVAGLILSKVDYDECIHLLPQVMEEVEDPRLFTLAWTLVHKQEPEILAEDLWTQLDEEHIQYFIQALRFSSGDFKDERSKEFLKEITRRITQ